MIRLPEFSGAVADYQHLTKPLERGFGEYREGLDKAYAEKQRLEQQGYQRRRNAMADARSASEKAESKRRWDIENERADKSFGLQAAAAARSERTYTDEQRARRVQEAARLADWASREADPEAAWAAVTARDPELGNVIPQGMTAQQRAGYLRSLSGVGDTTGATQTPAQRASVAQQYGLSPDDPSYRQYVLTGKMPREDQQDLTATDKKAILDADETVSNMDAALSSLEKAKQINPHVNSGVGASTRAWIGNNLPGYVVPDFVSSPEGSRQTADYENLVLGQALSTLKATFGGAPTEGERQILLDLQASVSKPPEVRAEILRRALSAAQRRRDLAASQADGIRGGSYYKSQPPQPGPVSAPQRPNAGGQPLRARNPQTGQVIESDDGGQTWRLPQ